MTRHLVCLTIDTDADAAPGKSIDRYSLKWDAMAQMDTLPDDLDALAETLGCQVPVTWFVRGDGQLRSTTGTALYLLEKHEPLWSAALARGHELGWHPHLYRRGDCGGEPVLITDTAEACDELARDWSDLQAWRPRMTAFRNGEAWHSPDTFAIVEQFGFGADSSVIPGTSRGDMACMDWRHAPNEPYFPDQEGLAGAAGPRPMVEVPITTWFVQAPYDKTPRLRYMNPCIHERIFGSAVVRWERELDALPGELYVWVLILHPYEAMGVGTPDLLYAHSRVTLSRNVATFVEALRNGGHLFHLVTVSEAAAAWRQLAGSTP